MSLDDLVYELLDGLNYNEIGQTSRLCHLGTNTLDSWNLFYQFCNRKKVFLCMHIIGTISISTSIDNACVEIHLYIRVFLSPFFWLHNLQIAHLTYTNSWSICSYAHVHEHGISI
jgi:hypothetical protein